MCGAKVGGPSTEGIDATREAVVQGVVLRADEPVAGAYVRLLDASGEFTAEVPTSASGGFRFFAAPGTWTVRALAPGATAESTVVAALGEVTEVQVRLPA
jgi:Protein of unknown function (DUF1416)